jgi:hypothetical protein
MREIEIYETEIELRKQGKMDEKLFAETRLRRGAYGQRYDNGQRWDGKETQTLSFPSSATELTKGVNTVWDAPGMQRIKVPFGGMNPEQLEVMAELAEEYSDGIAHVTTPPVRFRACVQRNPSTSRHMQRASRIFCWVTRMCRTLVASSRSRSQAAKMKLVGLCQHA